MRFTIEKFRKHKVYLEQKNTDYINIMIDGQLVGWINDEKICILKHYCRGKFGLNAEVFDYDEQSIGGIKK